MVSTFTMVLLPNEFWCIVFDAFIFWLSHYPDIPHLTLVIHRNFHIFWLSLTLFVILWWLNGINGSKNRDVTGHLSFIVFMIYLLGTNVSISRNVLLPLLRLKKFPLVIIIRNHNIILCVK